MRAVPEEQTVGICPQCIVAPAGRYKNGGQNPTRDVVRKNSPTNTVVSGRAN